MKKRLKVPFFLMRNFMKFYNLKRVLRGIKQTLKIKILLQNKKLSRIWQQSAQ